MNKTMELLRQAAMNVEGDKKAFIGAALSSGDYGIITGGEPGSVSFLLASTIISVAATNELKPRYVLWTVIKAYRFLMKNLKGRPIGELHTIDARNLEDN